MVSYSWLRYLGAGALILVAGGSAAAILVGTADAGFHEYVGRATRLTFQKFMFFSSDVLSFYPLFDCFFWLLLLLGVYLLLTAAVVDLSSAVRSDIYTVTLICVEVLNVICWA